MLLLIKYTLLYGIVLMLVALGGMFSEHSGIINIALEGIMVIGGVDGAIYRTGQLLEKLPPQIAESAAGPTRQFAPVPPGGIVEEPLPEIQTDVLDFYRNFSDVIDGKAEQFVKIPSVRRVLAVMEACRKSSETGEAIAFE